MPVPGELLRRNCTVGRKHRPVVLLQRMKLQHPLAESLHGTTHPMLTDWLTDSDFEAIST